MSSITLFMCVSFFYVQKSREIVMDSRMQQTEFLMSRIIGYFGPMFGGKTGKLLGELSKFERASLKRMQTNMGNGADLVGMMLEQAMNGVPYFSGLTLIVRPTTDTRKTLTHDGRHYEAREFDGGDVGSIAGVIEEYEAKFPKRFEKAHHVPYEEVFGVEYPGLCAVGVDELQFVEVEQLVSFVKLLKILVLKAGLRVVMAALSLDKDLKYFGFSSQLIAILGPRAHLLVSECAICGETATLSHYTGASKKQVDVGAGGSYEARCLLCHPVLDS